MAVKNGGPAFPTVDATRFEEWTYGMTLRDYFAAKALQGWLASFGPDAAHPESQGWADGIASDSYAMADAMLKARSAS